MISVWLHRHAMCSTLPYRFRSSPLAESLALPSRARYSRISLKPWHAAHSHGVILSQGRSTSAPAATNNWTILRYPSYMAAHNGVSSVFSSTRFGSALIGHLFRKKSTISSCSSSMSKWSSGRESGSLGSSYLSFGSVSGNFLNIASSSTR